MKIRTDSKRFFLAPAVLAVGALVFAACSSTNEQSATNGNKAVAPVASPSASPAPDMASGGGSMKSSPGAESAPYDLQFIDTMSEHHGTAIAMARLAESKAQHAELKTFAQRIVDAQQKELAQMKTWRERWYAGKPQSMNMNLPGMMGPGMDMGKLNAASGAGFDSAFLEMMTPHHGGAVAMARDALVRAEHPEIKKLAQQIIDAQQKEIDQMGKWKTAWGSK